MKVLHILSDGPADLSSRIIDEQSRDNEVRVIDLSLGTVPYDEVIDEIASSDRVISW